MTCIMYEIQQYDDRIFIIIIINKKTNHLSNINI